MKTLDCVLSLAIFVLVFSVQAQARPSELHLRTGGFYAKYTGPITNEVRVPGILDVDYSLFTSNTTALVFRSTVVIEFPAVKNYYTFTGVGMRFFNSGPAFPVNVEEGGFTYTAAPKWRTYFGLELGLAQALVQSFGLVLQTNSSLVNVNANIGGIYTLGPQMGISTQLNLGLGAGYSSVSVMSTNLMGLIGLCFFF